MPAKVNLAEKLGTFSNHWAPRIVARYNDHEVRLVKVEGEFTWHQHDDTDELFLVLGGILDIEFRDRTQTLNPGELLVVPRGTEHRPCARHGEVQLLLIDPRDMPNTGDPATATIAVEI
ncbi:cupin domain-containing protein [Sphingomonas sp. ID1715]|uniref:cupin domain-containing protein n=1 Tax=Sphingomonas sp. ID1715 TaxID=1656898 RepID=UPI0014886787|nr:cupin domain-containing protein [Sphingomonas sp. ID1715]NNM75783.1 cupin domain-containing protein [Sphingomonas sp. ID1715]